MCDLVKKLRDVSGDPKYYTNTLIQLRIDAADRIEQLERELAEKKPNKNRTISPQLQEDIRNLTNWLNEDPDNPILLRYHMTNE